MRPEVRERQARSRSSCSAPSPSATSRSTRRSAARSRSSAASRCCRSTRSQKNEFALFGTNDSVLGPWGTFAKTKLHAKTAAVIYPQVPGIDVGAKVEKTSLEDAGHHDEARRLRPERDRPDRPAHRGRSPDGGHRRPAEQRRRLRQRREDAAAARRPGLEDRLEPALPERRGRGGPRRRPRAVGLRHRVDARRRQDGPGGRPVQQGDGDSSARRSSRRTRG